MINFFRRIRKKMADDNRPLKYMRYAIGEIVLVVVGILIALYINNWNEQRKEREKFDQILVEVEKELVMNINEVRLNLRTYYYMDSICAKILLDTFNFDDIEISDKYDLTDAGFKSYPIVIIDESFKNLADINNLNSRQDSIMKTLNEVNIHAKSSIVLANNIISETASENLKNISKYKWYKNYEMGSFEDKDMIDFFLGSSEYQNDLVRYWRDLTKIASYESVFENEGVKAYNMIHNYLQDKNNNHSDTLILDYDITEFKHYLGKYDWTWCSNKNNVADDSVVVSIEKDKLIYTGYRPNGQTPSRYEIIPVDKFHFRTERGGYYRMLFDKNGEVSGIFISLGPTFTLELKKFVNF